MDKEKDETKPEAAFAGEAVTAVEPAQEGTTAAEAQDTNVPAPEGEGEKPRSRWEALADTYADNNVEGDDEAFDVIKEELESLTEFKRNEQAVNERLIDVLNAEPDFRDCVGYLLQGASFREALARTMDLDSLTPAEGEPDRAAWDKAKEERLTRLKAMEEEDAKNAEHAKTILTNTEATKTLVEEFAKKHNMSDAEKADMFQKLADFASDILDMKVSENVLDMIYKAQHMEEILDEAREDGAVAERNRKIETMRMNKSDTDGLPSLDAGAGEVEPAKKEGVSGFFDDLFAKHGIK